jgi:tetratricopeptide (TPR) repeat protein
VKAPPAPKDIKTNEELYLTGLRVEQIHNPTVDPLQYYLEAVKRDPGDSRSNVALGIDYVKRGRYEEAITHLRKAIERISAGYTRPINTDAYYYLGLALRGQGQTKEAYDSFYRSTWDSAFHSAGYYQLAELSARAGNYVQAAEQVREALATNALDS